MERNTSLAEVQKYLLKAASAMRRLMILVRPAVQGSIIAGTVFSSWLLTYLLLAHPMTMAKLIAAAVVLLSPVIILVWIRTLMTCWEQLPEDLVTRINKTKTASIHLVSTVQCMTPSNPEARVDWRTTIRMLADAVLKLRQFGDDTKELVSLLGQAALVVNPVVIFVGLASVGLVFLWGLAAVVTLILYI